ncbi:MAG: glycosyltransferase [Methanobacterium sp.]|nr:glycosyltransferase [Methanobacterium sp.]
MNEMPLVSIIIPVYNAERFLGLCLQSIKNQTYNNIEVIVVESRESSDKTVEIAAEYDTRIFKLKDKERSPAINYGIKMAEGKYVYRVDSDFILDENLVSEAVELCEEQGYDAASVLCPPDPTISFWARVRKLEKDCYKGDLDHAGVRFFRKDVYDAIGGFNEELVAGEDYDLYNRFKQTDYTIGIVDAEELHMGEPKTIGEIIRKYYYYGKTLNNFLNENKGQGVKQMSPFRSSLLKNWKNFLKNPVLTTGFITYYLVIYSSTTVGMLNGYIKRKTGND